MKKTGIIVLSLFMVLLSGCGSTAQETPKNDTPSTVSDYDYHRYYGRGNGHL